jgi:hypothetical protein
MIMQGVHNISIYFVNVEIKYRFLDKARGVKFPFKLFFISTFGLGSDTIMTHHLKWHYFFPMAQQPLMVQGLLIIDFSRSHSDTPHSVGLLWTSDQPHPENSTWQHTTLTTDKHPCPRWDFFVSRFFLLIHFILLNPSVLLHVTYVPY